MDIFSSAKHLTSLLPVIVMFIQLSDAYLRSVAFFPTGRRQNPEQLAEKGNLWKGLILWGVCSLPIYFLLFQAYGIATFPYKAALMLGWVPYLLIFIFTVRREASQHVFVFGMSAVWSYSVHNLNSILLVICLDSTNVPLFLIVHALLYLLMFVVLLPFSRKSFERLLSYADFWSSGSQRHYVAILPLVILIVPMVLQADSVLLHSWLERLYRLFLPISFFVFERYVLVAAGQYSDYRRTLALKERLKARLDFLEKRQQIVVREEKQIAVMRHDLRHSHRLIAAMLRGGDTAGAKLYIRCQEAKLQSGATEAMSPDENSSGDREGQP